MKFACASFRVHVCQKVKLLVDKPQYAFKVKTSYVKLIIIIVIFENLYKYKNILSRLYFHIF